MSRPHRMPLLLALAASALAADAVLGAAPEADPLEMTFVRIPAGEFVMGSTPGETGRRPNEGPARTVRIGRAFELGVHEVTVGQFRAFVEATGYVTEAERGGAGGFAIDFDSGRPVRQSGLDWRDPGFPGFVQTDDHPVLLVSWLDTEAFCRWLGSLDGRTYRLPTEAEWEHAARGGTTTPWSTGADPASLIGAANVADRSLAAAMPAATWAASWDDGYAYTAPVGRYTANAYGLHDMHGNAWEWCADWYRDDAYRTTRAVDPRGPADGAFRAIRGGGWYNGPARNRSAQRIYFEPTFRFCQLSGFRVVREID